MTANRGATPTGPRVSDARGSAKWAFLVGVSLVALAGCAASPEKAPESPPNIVLIVADDLGYGELGSYGQQFIRTPNLDRLAEEGIRFTQFYSGSPVCAPARATLLTGLHTGHAYIRDNDEMPERGDVWNDPELEGQRPLPAGTRTLGHVLQEAGYVTAAIGKWGLGWTGSSGDPNRQGFDHYYGYVCQREAHNYYPTHLWRNGVKDVLDNERFSPHQRFPEHLDPEDPTSYAAFSGNDYAPDLMAEEALWFLEEHHESPFFLYLPMIVPHLALQVPTDSLAEYDGAFEERPYLGDDAYLPHPKPRGAYAAMITRMDRDIGRILARLESLGLRESTLVVFTSDNGPSWVGGVDREFFGSSGGLRGRKAQLYEGGIRVPFIARWPGRIQPGSTSDHVSAFWDLFPTFTELTGAETPEGLDGISMIASLTGEGDQPEHDLLYWEYAGSQQAMRLGRFKALRQDPNDPLELFDLEQDMAETNDVAADHPDVVARVLELMVSVRTESDLFPLTSKE